MLREKNASTREARYNEHNNDPYDQSFRDDLQDDQESIDVEDLAACLSVLGFKTDNSDVQFLMKHLDENSDGYLQIDELIANVEVINYHCFYGKELMREFKRVDKDHDGYIRYPEMLNVLITHGPQPLDTEKARSLLDKMARKFDTNFDGKFSYAEFVRIYMSDILPYKEEGPTDGEFSQGQEEEKPQHIHRKSTSKLNVPKGTIRGVSPKCTPRKTK